MEEFDISLTCQKMCLQRRKIEKKTSRHRWYTDNVIREKQKKTPNDEDDEPNDQQGVEEFEVYENVSSQIEGEKASKRHAIIGFWKRQEDGELRCYRQFRVGNPIYFKDLNPVCSVKTLLHTSNNQNLYMFVRNEEQDICIVKVDLEAARKEDDSGILRKRESSCCELPTIPVATFRKDSWTWLAF